MSKFEYMHMLQVALSPYSKEVQDEIINDFEEHFADGSRHGKSDQEIVNSLGSIQELLESLGDPAQYIGTVVQHAKPMQSSEAICTKLVVDGFIADIHLRRSTEDKIHAVYENDGGAKQNMQLEFQTEQIGDTFHVRLKKKNMISIITHSIFSGGVKITVNVPDGLAAVDVSAVSGDVLLHGIHAQALRANVVSGDIVVKSCVLDVLSVATTSGDMKLNDNYGNVVCKTTSGDISFASHTAEKIRLQTASGDVEYSGDFKHLSFSTVSGDIDLSLNGNGAIEGNTVSGDVDICLHTSAGFTSQFTSISGELHVDFLDYNQVCKRSGVFTCGEPDSTVKINSVSGDVTISDD